MKILPLYSETHLDLIEAFYAEAADYWLLADGEAPDRAKAESYFTDCPPNCDPAASYRLGVFEQDQLRGVAELSFGFPSAADAYLGLMLFAPAARGKGLGQQLTRHLEGLARARGASQIFLAVLEANAKGRAFWQAQGFRATGLSRTDEGPLVTHILHRLVKDL